MTIDTLFFVFLAVILAAIAIVILSLSIACAVIVVNRLRSAIPAKPKAETPERDVYGVPVEVE